MDIIENPLNANFVNAGMNLNYVQDSRNGNRESTSTDSLSQ